MRTTVTKSSATAEKTARYSYAFGCSSIAIHRRNCRNIRPLADLQVTTQIANKIKLCQRARSKQASYAVTRIVELKSEAPHCRLTPRLQRTPANIRVNLIYCQKLNRASKKYASRFCDCFIKYWLIFNKANIKENTTPQTRRATQWKITVRKGASCAFWQSYSKTNSP